MPAGVLREWGGILSRMVTAGWDSQLKKADVGQYGSNNRVHTGFVVDVAEAMAQRMARRSMGAVNGGCAREAPVHQVE